MSIKEIGIVILNYNDYKTTSVLVDSLLQQDYFNDNSYILIVDNVSTNDSFKILKEKYSDKIDVIQSDKNGGYAYGNNYGVQYLYKRYGIKYCAICNPDIVVTADTFSSMIKYLKHNEKNVKVVGCKAYEKDGEVARYCWKLPTVSFEMFSSLFIINRLFVRHTVNYSQEQLKKKHLLVDVVMGAFFVFDVSAFIEVGMFDERTFLYCEEQILSVKLKKHGYNLAVLNHKTYTHNHIYTNDVTKKINDYINHHKSKRIYIKYYKQCNKLTLALFDFVTAVGLLERKTYAKFIKK